MSMIHLLPALLLGMISSRVATVLPPEFNVRDYGATGDGKTLDTPAINKAIEAASAAGGGVVRLPAGTYLSFSIHLRSRVTLQLEAGCRLLAATPAEGFGAYDAAEPNEWGDKFLYQDFGHSHWHNSLLWGENLEDVTILGPGLIHGEGLRRAVELGRREGDHSFGPNNTPPPGSPPPALAQPVPGLGNKAIALKNCRNVVIRDLGILLGGHFALLASGVDGLTVENVRLDTNRDGLDIDSCRNVRIANCQVNAPNDDAIVLKSSFALGEVRACENITIVGCKVSGYDAGTVFDGTFGRTLERAPDRDGPTGRIKIGTESNGAFRKITIADCVFERSRGLALETVDGGIIEDVTVTNLTMREVTTAPIFLRLGNRARGPAGTPVGGIRRVRISGVVARDVDARHPILLAGLRGHPIEDVTLSDIQIFSRGGLTMDHVARQPAELVSPFFLRGGEPGTTGPREPQAVPEREKGYPEPSMFGLLPASAVYARHVRNFTLTNCTVTFAEPDSRTRVVLDDVAGVTLRNLAVPRPAEGPAFVLRGVRDFEISESPGVPDAKHENAEAREF